MNVWFLIIPVILVFLVIALVIFFWSVKNDQFEDLDRQGSNILFDDDVEAHKRAQPADKPRKPQS